MYSKIPLWQVLDNGFMLLNGSYVFAFEIFFPSIEGVERKDMVDDIERLAVFMKSLIRDKSVFISFLTEMTKDKDIVLNKYREIHAHHHLMKEISEQRIKSLEQKLIRRSKLIISIPLYRSAVEFHKIQKSSPQKVKEEIKRVFDFSKVVESEVLSFFEANYQIAPIRLTGEEMWQHLFSMTNSSINGIKLELTSNGDSSKSYRELLFLGDFYDDERKDYLVYMNKYIATVTIDMLPETISPAAGAEIVSQITFPCRYCVSIELPNQVDAKNTISKMRRNAGIFILNRSGIPEIEWNRSKAKDIDDVLRDEKAILVKVSCNLTVEGENEVELNEKVFSVINFILSELKTASCYVSKKKKASAYISTLGYFPDYSYNYQWTTLHSAISLVPVRGMFLGTIDYPVMLFSNRHNSITAINPVTKRQSKWSFVVIGPTGSGKSFITNYCLLSMLSLNPFVVIFDLAPMSSYRTLAYICDGEYVEARPTMKRNQTKNPFDFRLGFSNVPPMKYMFFDRFFGYILSDEKSPLFKEDQELLRRAIQRTYDRYLFESPKLIPERPELAKYRKYKTWVNLRDAMLEQALKNKDNKELRDSFIEAADYAHKQAMPTLLDLASTFAFDDAVNSTSVEKEISQKLRKRLTLYTDDICKGLFAGTTNFRTTKDFIVVNLGFLKDNPNLLIPTFFAYREHFWEKMAVYIDEIPDILKEIYGEEYFLEQQQRYKFMLIDEYHNFNVCREIILLTDKDFRQSRTYGIICGIITQSLRDIIYEAQGEKFSIFESASNKFLLRHTTPQNPQRMIVEYVAEKTGMNPKETELFASLSMSPGKYSEIYYLGEDVGKGVLRYEPLPIELWINTTHKDERYLRDMLIEKLIENKVNRTKAVSLVVSTLSELYPRGTIALQEQEREKVFYRVLGELLAKVKDENS